MPHDPPPAAPWELQLRPAAGGAWRPVFAGDEAAARAAVRSPPFARERGDLVVLRAPGGAPHGYWVEAAGGPRWGGRTPPALDTTGVDWEAFWEGPAARADAMVAGCASADPRAFLRAACDAADGVADLTAGDPAARRARQAARRAADGAEDPALARWAGDRLAGPFLARRLGPRSELAAAYAANAARWAATAAWFALGPAARMGRVERHGYLDAAFGWAAGARALSRRASATSGMIRGVSDADYEAGMRELAAVVRARVPLSALLLAEAGP